MDKGVSILLIGVLAALFLLGAAGVMQGASPEEGGSSGQSTILSVVRINETITIDGVADEPAWSEAPALIVMVQDGSIGNIDVTVRGLYDDDHIYLLAEWPDPTESVDKKLWTYNGTGWSRSGDEDRLAIFWNINDSVRGFNIGGCAMLCHGDRMHTNAPQEKADEWHWKAGRTNPAGYADDKLINSTVVGYGENELGVPTEWTGRHSDEKTGGGYRENVNKEKTGPRYYEPAPTDTEDARFLFQSEIDNGEAVEITSETVFNEGDIVPGYILERPVGSRGDIDSKGVWRDGVWTLEMRRRLNTGHDDDVQFDITRNYRFGIAVMDDTGGFEAFGRGHSFTLGASTLEFGGFGSETVTQLALIRDYLLTARTYIDRGNTGLAISTVTEARSLYNEIAQEISDADPSLHIEITNRFESARRKPALKLIDELTKDLSDASLVIQGKREPRKATFGERILSVWGEIQTYVFILLAIVVLHPLYRTARTARTPELRRLGIFMFIVILPVFIEGLGRLGILLNIPLIQSFSFTTNEYATLLWAIGMSIALVIARFGFNDVDTTIKSLRSYAEELKRSEARYRHLFDSTLDGVYQTNKDGVFTMMNQAGAKIFGYKSPEEMIGRNAKEFWADLKDREAFRTELMRNKVVSSYPIVAKRADGTKMYLEATSRVLEDPEGNFMGIEGILRDVTERKKNEEKLKQYSSDLEKSNRLKDIFIDIMRHDLLNPAGLSRGMAEVALEDEEDPDKKEVLQTILESNERMIDLIKNASLLSRLESGEKLEYEKADLAAVARNAALEMAPLAEERDVKVKIDSKGEAPANVNPLVHDVFLNLISNAIKYGSKDSEVVVKIEDEGGEWKVSVANRGESIPDKDKGAIFDRFKRLEKGAIKGSGLGLAIVKRVAEAHGGRVWVEDNPVGGSIFYVTIPKDRKKG